MKKLVLFVVIICASLVASPKVVVTYFMSTYRCYSCHYIEDMTRETLIAKYRTELEDSSIVFRTINIDEPENTHLVEKYQLETKSVVVSKMDGDEELSWDRLDTLWNHIDDEFNFMNIVTDAVNSCVK